MRHLASLAMALIVATAPVRAQEHGWVSVESNVRDAHVYADSLRLGTVALSVFELAPGRYEMSLHPAERGSWSVEPVTDAVEVTAGDTAHVSLVFPHYYRIESIPYGARVVLEREGVRLEAGATPVTLVYDDALRTPILLEKPGYLTVEIAPGDDLWNRHSVVLERAQRGREAEVGAEVEWHPPTSSRLQWIDYAAVGLALVSGIVAVHYKFQADDLYAQYEETGDPTLRNRISKLDVRSGIALGAMQVGVGVFAIRLALR